MTFNLFGVHPLCTFGFGRRVHSHIFTFLAKILNIWELKASQMEEKNHWNQVAYWTFQDKLMHGLSFWKPTKQVQYIFDMDCLGRV